MYCKLTFVKQGGYAPEQHMQHRDWQFHPALSQEYRQPTAPPSNDTSSTGVESQNQFWESNAAYGNANWDSFLSMEPFAMSNSKYHSLRSHDLTYPHMAAQDMLGKDINACGSQISWSPFGPRGVPRGMSVYGSDMETSSSRSPKSYLGEILKSDSLSPSSLSDQNSSGGDWSGCSTIITPVKGPSPTFTLSRLPLESMSPLVSKTADKDDCSNIRRSLGTSVPHFGASHQGNELTGSFDRAQHTGPECSHLQKNNPGTSAWCHPWCPHDDPGSSSKPRGPELDIIHGDSSSNAFSSPSRSGRQQQLDSWFNSCSEKHSQAQFESKFQISQTADSQAQRKHNDDLLIQGKKNGLTYKEIREQMVGQKPAESTLRGRYRALTKERKDRVRKPVWTQHDVSSSKNPLFCICRLIWHRSSF